jgi:hypothetical protein
MLPAKAALLIAERKKKESTQPLSPGGTIRRSGRGKGKSTEVEKEGAVAPEIPLLAHDIPPVTNDNGEESGEEEDGEDEKSDSDFEPENPDPSTAPTKTKTKSKQRYDVI